MPVKTRPYPFTLFFAALLLLTGCGSAAKLSRFEAFSETGVQYAGTMDELLLTAANTVTDASSRKLLRNRSDLVGDEALTPDLAEAFRTALAGFITLQDSVLSGYLLEIGLARKSVRVLGDYFGHLGDVVSSDAPDAFLAELRRDVVAADELYARLRDGDLIGGDDRAETILGGGVGGLIVRNVKLSQLEAELEASKETIANVLLLHQALLDVLHDDLMQQTAIAAEEDYEVAVRSVYLDPGGLGSQKSRADWIETRRALLTGQGAVAQLEEAAEAAKKLRAAWINLLSDDLTPADLHAIAGDIDAIAAVVEALKKP